MTGTLPQNGLAERRNRMDFCNKSETENRQQFSFSATEENRESGPFLVVISYNWT
ncbi:unnamed protein product, partial [Nesidiocoris tenuis]